MGIGFSKGDRKAKSDGEILTKKLGQVKGDRKKFTKHKNSSIWYLEVILLNLIYFQVENTRCMSTS